MARANPRPGALDQTGYLSAAIALLGALANSTRTVDARSFARDHGFTDEQMEDVIELIGLVSDNNTGARVALWRDGDRLGLTGSAGAFDTVRFTQDEAAALNYVLERFRVEPAVRERVQAALAPLATPSNGSLLAGDPLFGGFFQTLCEAVVVGARVRLTYQSGEDMRPTERLIDPGFFDVAGDAAHLIAWDVERDAQRTYRLDRITAAEMTDDSVERHPFVHEGTAASLKAAGVTVKLRFETAQLVDQCPWKGLRREEAQTDGRGRVTIPVSCTSKHWLFDQVLAAGGSPELLEPASMRRELVEYARRLYGI